LCGMPCRAGPPTPRPQEANPRFDRMIMAWHRSNPTSKRLNCIPGVGPLLATALVASVGDPKTLRSGRNFSAWIGLVPKQHSSGGRDRLGSISKQGDRYLCGLFVAGASRSSAMPRSTAPRSALGRGVAGKTADQSRRHRAGQQARPHGLGNDVLGRTIQLSARAEGLTKSRRIPGVM
jgi:transposase